MKEWVRGFGSSVPLVTPSPQPSPRMGRGSAPSLSWLYCSRGRRVRLHVGGRRRRPATGRGNQGRGAVSGQQFFSARKILLAACFAASLGALAAPAAAQGYPNRPVKIVVPFVPGGPTEFIIRLLADRLTGMLGQPFVIENRPGGAGGTVGAKSVASAEADGYTLLFSSPGPLVTAAAVYRNLDYDPIKSFTPIAMVIYAPQMLVVHPSVAAESLPELVAYAKRNPGKITFGSSGYGTQPHMLGEMLKRTADINIIHVPYRGAGQSVTDLLAGQVQMIFETTAILLPHVQGGRLRALAVATQARSPLLPGVPTTAESGYPKLVASFWSGLLAPAGTPP